MEDNKCKDCGSDSDFPHIDKYNCDQCGVRDDVTGEF
jgi:hypothetical protein